MSRLGNMEKAETNISQIFVGVASTLICVICLGMFKMHTDVEVLKTRIDTQDKLILKQQEYSEKFDQMIQKFDKTLALQAATVQSLKETVEKMDMKYTPPRR